MGRSQTILQLVSVFHAPAKNRWTDGFGSLQLGAKTGEDAEDYTSLLRAQALYLTEYPLNIIYQCDIERDDASSSKPPPEYNRDASAKSDHRTGKQFRTCDVLPDCIIVVAEGWAVEC